MPTSYPPAFSENAVSSAIGQINDFSGSSYSSSRAMSAPNAEAQRALASLGQYDSVPVVITGTRPPLNQDFPGLREAMIGSAIFQLADQLPEDNLQKEAIKKLALELHVSGGEKIVRSRKSTTPPSNGTKRSRKA